jgi:hypothetical protein
MQGHGWRRAAGKALGVAAPLVLLVVVARFMPGHPQSWLDSSAMVLSYAVLVWGLIFALRRRRARRGPGTDGDARYVPSGPPY